jgi:hypothetical protein
MSISNLHLGLDVHRDSITLGAAQDSPSREVRLLGAGGLTPLYIPEPTDEAIRDLLAGSAALRLGRSSSIRMSPSGCAAQMESEGSRHALRGSRASCPRSNCFAPGLPPE